MKKTSFWKSEVGHLSVAAIILLAAFSVSLIGLNAGSDGILYLGLAMILCSLLSAPFMVLLNHLKGKK